MIIINCSIVFLKRFLKIKTKLLNLFALLTMVY